MDLFVTAGLLSVLQLQQALMEFEGRLTKVGLGLQVLLCLASMPPSLLPLNDGL